MVERDGTAELEDLVATAREEEARLLRLLRELETVAQRHRAAARRALGGADPTG